MADGKFMERLKMAMDFRDVSITSLSLDMGVSKASVSEWLKAGKIAFEHLSALSLQLNVSLDWLLLGRGKMELYGPVHPSETEREMIGLLHQIGGPQALTHLHSLINSLLQSQMNSTPLQQILDYRMLEEMGCPLCVINTQGLVCDANAECLSMLGLDASERNQFVHSKIRHWIQHDYLLQAMDRLKDVTGNDGKSSMYCEFLTKKPAQKPVPVTIIAKSRMYHGEMLIDCIFLPE